MMKPGIKLLFIALSCLTLASGCTKKKSSNSSKAPVKAETKTDPTGGIKTDPKPDAAATAGGEETPSPSATTPAPTPTPTPAQTPPKVTKDASGSTTSIYKDGTVVVTPPAKVTPPAQQTPQAKSDIEKYEECVVPAFTNILTSERQKNADSIDALKLFETKLSVLKSCQRPASIAADFADTLVTKKIFEFVEVKFIDAEGNADAFYEIERQQLSETERRRLYEQIIIDAKAQKDAALAAAAAAAVRQQVPSATPSQVVTQPAPTTTPTPTVTPTPAAIVPQTATVPAKPNTPPTVTTTPATPAGKAASAPQQTPQAAASTTRSAQPAAAPAQQKAEPVKAATNADNSKNQAATKDSQAVADFKQCFNGLITTSLGESKKEKVDIVSPRDLAELKESAEALCDMTSTKDAKLPEYTTKFIVDILAKDFPKSAASAKLFVETEKQKLAPTAKLALYDKFDKENKIQSRSAKLAGSKTSTAAPTTSPAKDDAASKASAKTNVPAGIEVKDTAALEACMEKIIEPLMVAGKKEKSKIGNPVQLLALQKMSVAQCKITDSKDVKKSRIKVISQKALAHFPEEKELIGFYTFVEGISTSEELSLTLYKFFNVYIEMNEKNSHLAGTVEPTQTKGNVVTYSLKKTGGELISKVQAPGKPAQTATISLDEIQPEGVHFEFDFAVKANKTSTLTIKQAHGGGIPLDFTIVKGDLAQLKAAKQSINIALTMPAWRKLWELKLRQNMGISYEMAKEFPLKFQLNAPSAQLPLCELSSTEMKCSDPDVLLKLKVNLDALNLQ